MLNNRLIFSGQFGYRDNATKATPSFIGDFDLQYLLFPNGNLAMKVYNQTNDRYFTRSSLNTQGIIKSLSLEVLLVEEHRSEHKAHDHTTPSDHRYDGNHRTGQTQ